MKINVLNKYKNGEDIFVADENRSRWRVINYDRNNNVHMVQTLIRKDDRLSNPKGEPTHYESGIWFENEMYIDTSTKYFPPRTYKKENGVWVKIMKEEIK